MNDTVWFARFGDIPGIDYDTPKGLDFRRLPRRNAKPEVERFGSSSSLWWETRDGGTSASPAQDHQQQDLQHASVSQINRNIAEVLELPGTPSDYHFALQSAAGALYTRRVSDPATIDDAERLYLLDIALIQQHPAAVTREGIGGRPTEGRQYVTIHALGRLLRLYLTEGRINEAVAIAGVAHVFGAGDTRDAVAARARNDALTREDA